LELTIHSDRLPREDERSSFSRKDSVNLNVVKGKGKAIPLQARSGPQIPKRLRLPDLKTIGTWRW